MLDSDKPSSRSSKSPRSSISEWIRPKRRRSSPKWWCGGVWLDPGELEILAPEEHKGWLGGLLSRMTGREEGSC
jgi:hypothetical protein